MLLRPTLLAFALLLPVVPATALAQDDTTYHTIDLGRHIKPGDRYTYQTVFREEQRTYTRDEKGKISDTATVLTVQMKAQVAVATVTLEGEEHEKTLTVGRLVVDRDGNTMDYLPAGTTITATFEEAGSVFTVDGRRPADSVAAVLATILHPEGGEKTSRIMDPVLPVRVGGTWTMNTDKLLEQIPTDVLRVDPKAVKTSVKLVAIGKAQESPCYYVVGNVMARGVQPQGYPDLEFSNATMAMAFAMTVPVDSRYPLVETSTTTALDMPARPKQRKKKGPKVDYQIRITRQQDSSFER